MNKPIYKIITIVLLITFVSVFLLFPAEANAKLRPKQFVRWVKKKVNQIVNLPKKMTRWMGPVLGPIAADILSANLTKHHKLGKLFRRLNKANKVITSIEEQQQLLKDVQKMYTDQSQEIRDQIKKLEQAREQLKADLVKPGSKYEDYRDQVIALDQTIEVYEKAAQKFDAAASRITTQEVIKMAGQELLKQAMGQLKNAVIYETSKELEKLIDPNIISTLIGQDNIGANTLIDLLVFGDIARVLNKGEYGESFDADALAQRVRERIKEILKENKDALKDNFKAKVEEIINDMIAELEEEKDKYQAGDEALKKEEEAEEDQEGTASEESGKSEPVDYENPFPMEPVADEHGCLPGYSFDPKSGVGCVQADCYSITHAHLDFTGHCVCGSSGSMFENPEDPNQECFRLKTDLSCPGCVHACVGLKEECPNPPKK